MCGTRRQKGASYGRTRPRTAFGATRSMGSSRRAWGDEVRERGHARSHGLGGRYRSRQRPENPGLGTLRRSAAALIGADLFGGVWANATPAAARWYHGRGQGTREMVAFSALHLHPFLVAALYRDHDWHFAFGNYAYLLAATAVTATAPEPLRWAVALSLCGGGILLNTALWRPTPGMEWFPAVFFLKLLASHAAGKAPTYA